MSKNNYKSTAHQKSNQPAPKPVVTKKFPWLKFSLKLLFLFFAVFTVVCITDQKEYFVGDQSNNHSGRKWRAFYKFAGKKSKNVDILVLGNSHASAGIEPYILSENTGSYCFILNTPGAGSVDLYYNLVEVLKYNKPKIVIIETSCLIGDGIGKEWACIQSIESKKGFFNRLSLIPHYLSSDDWVKAVSPTIRNHSFLLTDTARIAFNVKNVGKDKNPPKTNFELGRFSHGNDGMSDSIYNLFKNKPGPLKCSACYIADKTRFYVKKLYDLCEENDIELMFITVPMHPLAYENYDFLKNVNQKFFKEFPKARWLDLQSNCDTTVYTRAAFNNEYGGWQHNTYMGMVLNTYQLCNFISKNYPGKLPNRSSERAWIEDFSKDNNFIYNQPVLDTMKDCHIIAKDVDMGGLHIRECFVKDGKDNNTMVIKVDNSEELSHVLPVVFRLAETNQLARIDLYTPPTINPPQYKVYMVNLIKDVRFDEMVGIMKLQ